MKSSSSHLPSLLLSLLFILGSVSLISIGFFAAFAAIVSYVNKQSVQVVSIILSFAYGFEGLLIGLITVFTIQKFFQNPYADQDINIQLTLLNLLAGGFGAAAALWIGSLVQVRESINWLILPLLTIPAVVLPIWLVFKFGVQKLPLGERWQAWSMLGLGMTLAPLIILILELGTLIVIGVMVVIYIASQPNLVTEFQSMAQQITRLQPDSPELLNLLKPYITKPITILLILSYFSFIIPVIEELIKPLGVWLFHKQIESVAQGFAFGALCGTGYALAETFGVSGQVSEWSTLLTTRIGTGLLHITASGIMGAGITGALRYKRYLFFIRSYILSVLLHGLWNATAVAYSFSTNEIFHTETQTKPWIVSVTYLGLFAVALMLIVLLFINNRKYTNSISLAPEATTSSSIESPQDQNNS